MSYGCKVEARYLIRHVIYQGGAGMPSLRSRATERDGIIYLVEATLEVVSTINFGHAAPRRGISQGRVMLDLAKKAQQRS